MVTQYGERLFEIDEFEIVSNLFTPAEFAEITGLNVDLQRVWRRRGFLPVSQGHARFSMSQVAHTALAVRLGEYTGYSLEEAHAEAARFVKPLLAHLFYGMLSYHAPLTVEEEATFMSKLTPLCDEFIADERSFDFLISGDRGPLQWRKREHLNRPPPPHYLITAYIDLSEVARNMISRTDRALFSVLVKEPVLEN